MNLEVTIRIMESTLPKMTFSHFSPSLKGIYYMSVYRYGLCLQSLLKAQQEGSLIMDKNIFAILLRAYKF